MIIIVGFCMFLTEYLEIWYEKVRKILILENWFQLSSWRKTFDRFLNFKITLSRKVYSYFLTIIFSLETVYVGRISFIKKLNT